MYKTAYLTDRGLKRKINEDALLVSELSNLFVVADGMGGHNKGEVASKIVIETFQEIFSIDKNINDPYNDETLSYIDDDITISYNDSHKKEELESTLNRVIEISTNKIKNYAKENNLLGQIGTTVVGVYKLKDKEQMALFHLGDSRVYRIRENRIKKLTIDHSKYEKMKQSGRYTNEQLAKVNRNSITKAIGNFKVMPLEIHYTDLKIEDIFILCSDGISDLTHAQELLEIVKKEKNDLENVIYSIKKIVYSRGAKDNLSIIIFKYK